MDVFFHRQGTARVTIIASAVPLFFNADLVQHRLDVNGGAMTFVDDYNAWVTGHQQTRTAKGFKVLEKAVEVGAPCSGRIDELMRSNG